MIWTVTYSKKAEKQYNNLPRVVQDRLDLLAAEIELSGPVGTTGKTIQSWQAENGSTIVTLRPVGRRTLLYGKKLTTQ